MGPRGAGGHQAPLSPLLGGSGEHGERQFTGLEDEVDCELWARLGREGQRLQREKLEEG